MQAPRVGLTPRRRVGYVIIILVSVTLIYFLVARGMRFFVVPSDSMNPTIVPPEYLLTLSQETYRRGDVVVLKDPEEAGAYIVKRIVGLSGDILQIRGGALFLNEEYASEPYLAEPMDYEMTHRYEVSEGEAFVLGDNRNWSIDSHSWNSGVPVDDIVGKVRFVYLPFSRMRKILSYPLTNVQGT